MAANEAITEINEATTALGLFSKNRKRAGITYRRLMRQVHPDIDPSDEAKDAATKLNALWQEWQDLYSGSSAKPKAKRSKPTLRRMARMRGGDGSTAFVIFRNDSDGSWMQVTSKPSADHVMKTDDEIMTALNSLQDKAKGSPVLVPNHIEQVMVNQKDGQHEAMRWTTDPAIANAWTADDLLKTKYGHGVHGRDIIWILKRFLYLDDLVNHAGLSVDTKLAKPEDAVLIAPSAHTIMLGSPLDLHRTTDDDYGRPMLQAVRNLIGPATGDQSHKLAMFINGCISDDITSGRVVMSELDELSYELYGEPAYHRMDDPE